MINTQTKFIHSNKRNDLVSPVSQSSHFNKNTAHKQKMAPSLKLQLTLQYMVQIMYQFENKVISYTVHVL